MKKNSVTGKVQLISFGDRKNYLSNPLLLNGYSLSIIFCTFATKSLCLKSLASKIKVFEMTEKLNYKNLPDRFSSNDYQIKKIYKKRTKNQRTI